MPRRANPNKPVLETVTTRAPAALYSYAKAVAAVKYGTMLAMSAEMMDRFLHEEPWSKGLRFRPTQALSGRIGTGTYATGWIQVNLRLRPELVERIKIAAEQNDVSPSSFVYTAFYWWCWYIYPPKSEQRRREAAAREAAAKEAAAREATAGTPTSAPKGDEGAPTQKRSGGAPAAKGGGNTDTPKKRGSEKPPATLRERLGGSSMKPAPAPPRTSTVLRSTRKGSSKSRS